MTDQLFIEHALKVAGIELDKQANATVSGEWYFWFSPFVHSKQMESIIEFFDFAANPNTSESTLFWTNYALSLDLFLTVNTPIRGSVDTSFGFSKIGDKQAHIQIVRNSYGFVAVRIQHLKTESEQRQASLQVRAELMYLLQLYSVRCHKKKSEDIEATGVSGNKTLASWKGADVINSAETTLVMDGYHFHTVKYFSENALIDMDSCDPKSMILTAMYYSSRTKFLRYSLPMRILMFLLRQSYRYYDALAEKRLA